MSQEYHLGEFQLAQDPTNPRHILPPPLPAGLRVLDVGCGAGQSLIAAYPDRLSFGVDVDFEALKLGRSLTERVAFANAAAEALPYASGQFDFVTARVSLPYTNLSRSLREMRRVLKKGGGVWMTLHPLSIPWSQAKVANVKGRIFFAYVVLNSLLFHFVQRQFPFLGRYESFQTGRGMRRALEKNGFRDISITQGRHFVVTARAD
jgi:ubiquinone/menaquinone biosynthesis C-methylase UbiE